MALNGAAAGIIGSSDSGTDAIVQLQRATITFAEAYKKADSAEALQAAKREVIGKIMVAVALDAITEQKADELTEALMQLMKGKK